MTVRWPNDGVWPCPDSGPALLARIEQRIDPWAKLRIEAIWLFSTRIRQRKTARRWVPEDMRRYKLRGLAGARTPRGLGRASPSL